MSKITLDQIATLRSIVRDPVPGPPVPLDVLVPLLDAAEAHLRRQDAHVTHSDDCWRWHHACALRRIAELEADNARDRAKLLTACQDIAALKGERDRLARELHGFPHDPRRRGGIPE